MSKTQLDRYRQKLSDLAEQLEQQLAHDQREIMRMDEPDFASIPSTGEVLDSGMQEVETAVMANDTRLLDECKAAITRIDAGIYGKCRRCERPISGDRLAAIPYARHCIRCARESE